ncbi:hypothetical protein Ciccas_011748, partial [Cichlidogyrus casuarinus]
PAMLENTSASQWFAPTPDRHDAECLFCNFKPAMGNLISPVTPTPSSSSKTSDASVDDDSDPLYEAQEDSEFSTRFRDQENRQFFEELPGRQYKSELARSSKDVQDIPVEPDEPVEFDDNDDGGELLEQEQPTTSLQTHLSPAVASLVGRIRKFLVANRNGENWFALQSASRRRDVEFPFDKDDLERIAKLIGLLTPIKDLVTSFSKQAATCANLHRVAVFFRTKPDETGLLNKIVDRLEGFEKAQNKAKFTEAATLLAATGGGQRHLEVSGAA